MRKKVEVIAGGPVSPTKRSFSKKKVVVIGGGTGTYQVLVGLKNCSLDLDITAIVTMADSGGSSGKLREEFGMLPPGDVRRALLALSDLPISKNTLGQLFEFRFDPSTSSGLAGHSMGNLLLAALTQIHGKEELAISEAEKILSVSGHVLPVTLSSTHLHGLLNDGTIVKGETNIDVRRIHPEVPIKEVYLEPKVKINPKAKKALLEADLIVLGPGDLFTSIIPNLLVSGVCSAIKKSKGKLAYICNLMTKHGETNGYSAKDFVDQVKKYLGQAESKLGYVLVNENTVITDSVRKWYKKYHSEPVEDGISDNNYKVIKGSFAQEGKLVRHDPEKLAKALEKLL